MKLLWITEILII